MIIINVRMIVVLEENVKVLIIMRILVAMISGVQKMKDVLKEFVLVLIENANMCIDLTSLSAT